MLEIRQIPWDVTTRAREIKKTVAGSTYRAGHRINSKVLRMSTINLDVAAIS